MRQLGEHHVRRSRHVEADVARRERHEGDARRARRRALEVGDERMAGTGVGVALDEYVGYAGRARLEEVLQLGLRTMRVTYGKAIVFT